MTLKNANCTSIVIPYLFFKAFWINWDLKKNYLRDQRLIQQEGFSLSEFLISLLIFSAICLDFLGIALHAMQAAQENYWRCLAILQARNIAETLILNKFQEQKTASVWQERLQTQLPEGHLTISWQEEQVSITITWQVFQRHQQQIVSLNLPFSEKRLLNFKK